MIGCDNADVSLTLKMMDLGPGQDGTTEKIVNNWGVFISSYTAKAIKLVFVASLLSTQHGERAKTG